MPNILQHPKSAAILRNGSAILECNATSNPISSVTWLKDGSPINSYPNVTVASKSYIYSRITISQLTWNDQGWYQCRYNLFNHTTSSNNASVIIYGKSLFVMLILQVLNVQ